MTNEYLYGKTVPISRVAYYGVTYSGRGGWDIPDGQEYGDVREKITGTRAMIGYGGHHTWDDWEAYWTGVTIGAPDVETYYVNVPGRMGNIDMSEALTGAPVYKDREVDIGLTYPGSGAYWHEEYSDIMEQLHGVAGQLILDSDPGYYYDGRSAVSSERLDSTAASFTISSECNPFKWEINDSLGDWLWDPWNFIDGVIREYGRLPSPANESVSFTIEGSSLTVGAVLIGLTQTPPSTGVSSDFNLPDFEFAVSLDGEEILATDESTYNLRDGFEFELPPGEHTLTISNVTGSYAGAEDVVFALYFRGKRL